MNNNKTLMITGGTGSLGKAAIKFFLKQKQWKKIIVFSRDELKQSQLKKKFTSNKLRFFIGDVRDYGRLLIATKKVDYIIHAAALKQVDTAEYNPTEFIETNIIGAKNIIEVCSRNRIKKVIALSTDKACLPINLYGATKLCSDKLFVAANNYIIDTIFSVVRYGNVEGSRGSVIPFFKSLDPNSKFPITSIEMTRFSLSLKKSLDVVNWSLKNCRGGEIVVPKIPSYKILDLIKAINPKAKYKIIGIRSGEKINENLISRFDSENTIEIKNHYIIIPRGNKKLFNHYIKKIKGKKVGNKFSFSSDRNKNFLNIKQLKNVIDNI